MNVRVGRLDSSEEGVLLTFLYLSFSKEPQDVRPGQSFNLTLQVKLLALLSAGGFSEEGWLYPALGWSIFIFHGQADMVSLLTVLVTNIDHVVTGIIVRQMPGIGNSSRLCSGTEH